MSDAKMLVKWSPEGASAREWTVDLVNPAWDLRYQTEMSTGWPWSEFVDKLGAESAIAMRALLFTLRKRDEPRLSIESVTVEPDELEFEDVEPPVKKPKKVDKSGDDAAKGAESGEA